MGGESLTPPRVSIVCGPIGNLGDITYRAVEALRQADLIACEDTRHSRRLLDHYEITGKALVSLHEHNEESRSRELVDRILSGVRVALLTDAGTPCISDPGYRFVNACVAAKIPVEVLPGPSALTTALAGSALPPDAFYFGGFLPVKAGRREKKLAEALERAETTIHFESPHRIGRSLGALAELDPDRPVCVAREMTKRYETFHRGSASELADTFRTQPAKGEIVLLIRGLGQREKKRREPSR